MALSMKGWPLALAALGAWLMPVPAPAATRQAADCSLAAVTSAVASAATGDTVRIPAGTCTWASPLELPATRDLTLSGAGSASTLITCLDTCVNVPTSVTTRVTAFSFTYAGTQSVTLIDVGRNVMPGPGKTFRVDHNVLTSVTEWGFIEIFGGGPYVGKHPTGLVDHNTFNGVAVHVNGTNFLRMEGSAQDALWAQATVLGNAVDVVYIEDNAFNGDRQNYVDGNYGARYVVRFNTMTGQATGVEAHSVQGNNRAVQRWEIYKNTLSKPAESFYPLAFIRGGTGVAFGNRANSNFSVLLDNVRSGANPDPATSGACDGTSAWDQNLQANGYACRDQLGRGRDTVLWTGPPAPYTQPLTPAYLWDNLHTSATPLPVVINQGCSHPICVPPPGNNAVHLVENRDWYRDSGAFNGTAGLGSGPASARPATCTPGVAYWATDEGDWNQLQPGPDGQLYTCTAPNTWTLSYVPYLYPHPLQADVVAPAAPSGLTVQ